MTSMANNIFRELGFPNPELHKAKAVMVSMLSQIMTERTLSVTQTAARLGISADALRAITAGDFDDVAADQLLNWLFQLGTSVELGFWLPSGNTHVRRIEAPPES